MSSVLPLVLRLLLLAVLSLAAHGKCLEYGPVIDAVSGCPWSDVWGTYSCVAGMTLTLTGANFTVMDQWSQVSIRASGSLKACSSFQVVNDSTVTATLPNLGDGALPNPHQIWILYSMCQFPIAPQTVSYLPPSSSSSSSASPAPSNDSSSTGAAARLLLPTPAVSHLSGCNNNASGSAADTSQCDGSSGASFITVSGANFTSAGSAVAGAADSLTVRIACQSGGTYGATADPLSVSDSSFRVSTPRVDKSDVNSTCSLTVSLTNLNYANSPATSSDSATLRFSSYAFDVEGAWELLGLSLKAFIAAAVVAGLVLVGVVLCTLTCCCGVSLACLGCCRTRSTGGVVYSPRAGGYAAMA